MDGGLPSDAGAVLRRRWAKARLFAQSISNLGLPTVVAIVGNTRRAWRRQRQAAQVPDPPPTPLGALSGVEVRPDGARLTFADAALTLELLADDVALVSWEPGRPPLPYAPTDPAPWAAPEVSVDEDSDGTVTVSGGRLGLRVEPGGTVDVLVDGLTRRRYQSPRRFGSAWEVQCRALAGERFFGLGEQAAPLDLAGGRYRLWNRDPGGAWGPGRSPLYLNIPVLLSTHAHGCLLAFFENPTRGLVMVPGPDDGQQPVTVRFDGGQLRQYVMVGSPETVLDRYSALTGRPARPARWALGYHQSRWGYKRAADVQDVIDGYAAMSVPLSAVHLDIDYMDGYRVFTVDRGRFPDLRALSETAGRRGTRLVAIVDPAVKVDEGYDLYRQGRDEGHFCTDTDGAVEQGVVWPGRAAFPDFTSPATRKWWAGQYRRLADQGISGIWHDMNEPTSITLAGDPTLPLDTRHHLEGRGGDHREAHNVYGLLMNRAGHEGLSALHPDRRPFIVSRSGWAGTQRYSWNWTGDAETSWASLRQQAATVVGLGLSGVAFSGPDIGGFSGVPDDELYLRWLQMAVFLPFCRTHSVVGAPPREPWRFRPPTRQRVAAWIRFRYRLLPYLYTLAHEASTTGAPLARPLWWHDPGAAASGAVDDTFLLGDDLVVAPVTEPAARRRAVPLPAGRWFDLWDDGPPIEGGRVAEVPVASERIPVYVRAGAVLPLDDAWADSSGVCPVGERGTGVPPEVVLEHGHGPLLLAFHCWPDDGAASGRCLDDAGDGWGAQRHDLVTVEGARAGDPAVVLWQAHGKYPRPARARAVLHGLVATQAWADGVEVTVDGSAVTCAAFEELRLDGLRPAVP